MRSHPTVQDLGESLARPLGGGEVGPIEPPEPPRQARASRTQWTALGAFAIVGATGILVISGVGGSPAADLHVAWATELPDAAVAPRLDAPARDTVFAISVAGLPALGPSDAMVTLVAVTDYACTGCERARPLLHGLRASYGEHLRIVYKPHDPRSIANVGACAASLQGELERFDQAMWRTRSRSLGEVTRVARDLGLDHVRFAADMKRCEPVMQASARELDRLRVGAPAFFVNGRFVDPWGIESPGTFQTVIDEELAHARRRIAAGASADRYYQQWVLDAGHTNR